MLKTVLFDLDGTLLPMDQDVFVNAYFGSLAKRLAPRGYEPNALIKAIWKCTMKVIVNDGTRTNEQMFWDEFCKIYGEKARDDIPYFDEYYLTDFAKVQNSCGFNELAAKTVELLHNNGVRTALATNPIFPKTATYARTRWAGLDPARFDLITTYENCGYCKPNPAYYKDILSRINRDPSECIMVGNDYAEDIAPARSLSMRAFLLTDCAINKQNADISSIPHGDFNALIAYLTEQISE